MNTSSHIPRIAIWHLLLWMLFSAVALAFMRTTMTDSTGMPRGLEPLWMTSGGIQSIIWGMTLTGAFVLTATRIRFGPPLLIHPGHYLILNQTARILLGVPLQLALALSRGANPSNMGLPLFFVLASISILIMVYALYRQDQKRWICLFAVLAVQAALQALLYVAIWMELNLLGGSVFQSLSSIGSLWRFVAWMTVVVVVVIDVRRRERRDWVHWAGIAALLAFALLNVLWMFAGFFSTIDEVSAATS